MEKETFLGQTLKLLRGRFFVCTLLIQVALLAGMAVMVVTQIQHPAATIGLHYTIYLGIDLLGPTWYFWMAIGFSAGVFLAHIVGGILAQRHGLALFGPLLVSSVVFSAAMAVAVFWSVALTRTLL